MLEFTAEESKLGLRKIPINHIIEKLYLIQNKNEIPKKQLFEIYKDLPDLDANIMKEFLVQDFFYTDNTKQKYDFVKIGLFNVLYAGGTEQDRADFLFKLLESSQTGFIYN